MRVAVLSDIHGNIWALESALADARSSGADRIINCGDILSGPLEPAATADLLIELDLPTIAGNCERQLLGEDGEPRGESDRFAFEHTSERHHAWLAALPPTLELPGGVFMCHGTPVSDREHFLVAVDVTGVRNAPLATLESRAGRVEHELILCGHTHLPGLRTVSRNRTVVNPGSVGLQAYDDDHPVPYIIENGSPHLRYALCERTARGWNVWHRAVSYDHDAAAATAKRNGRDDWARWLATGRT
jgi:putative phosphoesterase